MKHRPEERDERGAVLVLVALSMVALIGMVVLVVDVGGLLTLRRRMVTAADSAALAAAQSCIDPDKASEASYQANLLATDNVDGVANTAFQAAGCGGQSGNVSVAYAATQRLYFAPVLGSPERSNVGSRSRAMWGPSGGAKSSPIVINKAFLIGPTCGVPNVARGTECSFWYNRRLGDLSEWGVGNLDLWNVSATSTCRGAPSKATWITNGYPSVLPLNYPSATLVCADRRASNDDWDALRGRIGRLMFFPVGDFVPGGKYNITGFAALEVVDLLDGDDAEAVGELGVQADCSGTWNFSYLSKLNLDSTGCYTPPVIIENLHLYSIDKKGATVYQPGVDYVFDPTLREITWLRTASQNDVHVEFDWRTSSKTGKCGIRKPVKNAKCLVVRWQGVQTGGVEPNGGEHFGLAAIRLSE